MKIDMLLNRSKKDMEDLKKNTQKRVLPKESKKEIKESLELLNLYQKVLTGFRDTLFVKDITYEDIGIKKCVRNAFKEPKYKKVLDDYLIEKQKLKNKSEKDTLKFECYERLDEDIEKLEDIFDIVIKGLELIEEDIKQENFASVEVICDVDALISRLGQLYNLYGNYLEDINSLAEYTVISIIFQGIVQHLEELFTDLKED